MSYEAARDDLLGELLALGQAAANHDLQPLLGDVPAVREVYTFPANLQLISALSLPALTVYRRRTQSKVETTMQHRDDQLVTFHCGYLLPATAPADAAARWPLLRLVWESLIAAWDDGKHPAYLEGAQALKPHGVISDLGGPRKDEQWASQQQGQLFIGFVGEFQLLLRDEPDPFADLVPMADVHARYHIEHTPADTSEAGDVEDHIDTQ